MRIKYDEMKDVFKKILLKKGFSEAVSSKSAELFSNNSLDGVYSHGINRFPRVLSYIEKGYINPKSSYEVVSSFGAIEKWNSNLSMGNTTAYSAMERAIELADKFGIGLVSLANTNHWMRGGTYAWQAADAGMVGICWTNTMPNMPAWGTKETNIGNNPFVIAVPKSNGEHVVMDCALAQFSYGKIEETKLRGENLSVPGGYDVDGNITNVPKEIEESWRVLPIGFWKGSGLSIVLDLAAAIISGGNTVTEIGEKCEDEYSLSQILIAIDPSKLGSTKEERDKMIDGVLNHIKSSEKSESSSSVRYPGESSFKTRQDNLKNGIPVVEDIWQSILTHL